MPSFFRGLVDEVDRMAVTKVAASAGDQWKRVEEMWMSADRSLSLSIEAAVLEALREVVGWGGRSRSGKEERMRRLRRARRISLRHGGGGGRGAGGGFWNG